MEIHPDNGRSDVFDTASPRNTANTNGFEASTPALPLPPENARGGAFQQSPRNAANTDAIGLCAVRVNSTLESRTEAEPSRTGDKNPRSKRTRGPRPEEEGTRGPGTKGPANQNWRTREQGGGDQRTRVLGQHYQGPQTTANVRKKMGPNETWAA